MKGDAAAIDRLLQGSLGDRLDLAPATDGKAMPAHVAHVILVYPFSSCRRIESNALQGLV